jgi:hypothetical protein
METGLLTRNLKAGKVGKGLEQWRSREGPCRADGKRGKVRGAERAAVEDVTMPKGEKRGTVRGTEGATIEEKTALGKGMI